MAERKVMLVEYPADTEEGYATLEVALDTDRPLLEVVPEVLTRIKRFDGAPDPSIDIDQDALATDDPGFIVYFEISDQKERQPVHGADLRKTLTQLGLNAYTVMEIEEWRMGVAGDR